MKLHNNENDSFIITSNDILVNGDKSDVLTNVINKQEDKLTSLERNIKWLYKYGGTGSKGSGSSNGVSFSVDANVLFGNIIIQKSINQKLILSNSNKKYETLSISLNKTNILNIYQARITGTGFSQSKWYDLTQDNDYGLSFNVPVDDTGTIKIEIKGTSTLTGDNDNATYLFTYIKNPYVFNLSLIDNNDKNILDGDNLYVNEAIEKGVNLFIDYNIVSSKQISYEITCDETMLTNYEGIINDSEHGVGLGNLSIPFNSSFISNDNNYGSHTINIKFKIDPDESLGISNGQIITKNISFTYIPNNQIFFKIESTNNKAKIYKYSETNYNNAIIQFNLYKSYYEYFKILENEQELDPVIREGLINTLVDESLRPSITDNQLKDVIENKLNEIESELYIFNVGSLQLYLQAYLGSNTLNTVDVSYILDDGENIIDNELLSSLQYRKRQMINIPVQEEGVYKLCIYSKNQTEQQRIYYYFAAFDKNSGINWYNADVEFNEIDLFFKEGKIGTHHETNLSLNCLNTIKNYESVQKIQKYANGEPSQLFDISNELNLLAQPDCDIMLSFGIQYSYINSDNVKLMSILTNNNNSSLNLDIYQNRINEYNSSNTLAKIFIPKEHNYAPSNNENYHLLTLYKRYVYETNSPYYEIIIYIDGCPEAAFKNFVKDSSCWSSVYLNNSNFSLNFFELAYFQHNKNSLKRFDKNETSGTVTQNKVTYLDDIAISEYYYKYISTHKSLGNIISLLANLRNFKETDYGMIEVASRNDIDSIANGIDIPVLLLEYTDQSDNEFVNWFTKSYKETELTKDKKKLDYIYYSSGLNKLSQIDLPDELAGSYWYAALQGSSTGELFDKNLTLGINNQTPGRMGIFTPNFYDVNETLFNSNNLTEEEQTIVSKAKNSFLPETAYTLKADVVDSSHSNNTAVGAFVNANTTQFNILFDGGNTNKGNNKYVNYIKNCLLGFPVLVFANVNRNGKSTYYFLGIYNFNLGRDSYFNMGYYSPRILQEQNQISSALNNASGKDFIVTYVEFTNLDMKTLPVDDGVIVAEIQGGKEYFDFSQYHSTMLLPQDVQQGTDNGCMFGDFVPKYDPSKQSNADLRIRYHIPRLVEAISKAGGYLFDNVLHKHLGEYKYGYNKYIDRGYGSSIFDSANQVPNYKLQYVRAPQESDTDLQYLIHNFQKDERGQIILNSNGQPSIDPSYYADDYAVGRLLDTHIDEGFDPYQRGNDPILDYTSATEYYTACMGFGLVDSVMKNLNVKSWNATYVEGADNYKNGKWYVAFYDMDTSFGRDNGGAKTSYFAFSDYWKTGKTTELEEPTIYRDFYPMSDPENPNVVGQSMAESGFDIPSSYLFAVAKYAHLLNDEKSDSLLVPKGSIPHNIWARWRCISNNIGDISGPGTGELRSADYFIQKYFIRNLDNIPEQIWALNYRLKYLKRISPDSTNKYNYTYNTDENGSFENLNYIPFHGKGINELHEWLGGRLHILDSYFNLEGNDKLNIKYLEYTENESNENNPKFTPIIRLDSVQGYKYNDIDTPNADSNGNYKWLSSSYNDKIPDITPDVLGSNKDIEILKDIFSINGNGARYSQPIDIYIKSQEFSPFNITTAMGEKYKYLLEDPDTEYHISYKPRGLVITKFGGSTLWTYIRNLNTVINENTLTLNTENLDQIVLTKGKCSTYNISAMKSLKIVSIIKDLYDNDSQFTGTLTFALDANNTDPYPDLTIIELIRTEITLTCNGVGVSVINLSNTQSTDTKIINCKNLESVNLSGFTAPSLDIMPGWSNDMEINLSKVNKIKISPKDKTANERKISIKNDLKLTTVILEDFTHISLAYCPNLYNICILNPEHVESLEIIKCNTDSKANHNLHIYFNELDESSENDSTTIDLKQLTNIRSFKFNGTGGFNTLDASESDGEQITINGNTYNCLKLYGDAFSGTSLERIITKPNVYLYINSDNINGTTGTFNDSNYGSYPNKMIIGKNVKKLDSLFKHDLGGTLTSSPHIDSGFVADFINCNEDLVIFENIDNIVSLNGLFYGQTRVANSKTNHPFTLNKFKNVNDISYLFFGTSIFTYNKDIFGTDDNYCGMNVIQNNGEFKLDNFIPSGSNIDVNLFDYYINNIKCLISDNDYIQVRLNIYNDGDVVQIKNLFSNLNYDTNILESFEGFVINDMDGVDYADLLYDHTTNKFKFPKLKSIKNSFNNLNKYSINFNRIGLYEYDMSKLTLYNSFNFSNENIEKMNITQIINFDTFANNSLLPWHDSIYSLNGAKEIYESDLLILLKKLNTKKCITLNNLFKNTNIIIDDDKVNKNELILHSSDIVEPYIFRACNGLFKNAKLVDRNNVEYGIEITSNTLSKFTNVETWTEAFMGCTLHKNLPLNMFNLKTGLGDYKIDYYTEKHKNLSLMFADVKLDSNESWFNYNWTPEDYTKYNNGIELNGSYRKNITTLEGTVISNYECKDNYVQNGITVYGEHIVKNLILPWDIFYGCTSNCNIDGFIANSEFEGILPTNLFPKNTKLYNLSFSNTFKDVLVIPNFVNDIIIEYVNKSLANTVCYVKCPGYVFIPEYFTNSTDLTCSFNFKMLLPNSESLDRVNSDKIHNIPNNGINKTIDNVDSIELYFVLQDNSVSFGNLTSIKDFLPYDNVITLYDELNQTTIEKSLHTLDTSIRANQDNIFNARTDYGIHYYMYLNKELLSTSDSSYPWVEVIIKDSTDNDVTIYEAFNKDETDTGLPIVNNTKLLYDSIFNDDIISFTYGNIITRGFNLYNVQPISGSSPFINISAIWSDFGKNIILPLNERGAGVYYDNVFNLGSNLVKHISIDNIDRKQQTSLDNYAEHRLIDIDY